MPTLVLCLILVAAYFQVVVSSVCHPTDPKYEIPKIDEKSACRANQSFRVTNSSYGYIVNPGFDRSGLRPYPDGLDCHWEVQVPEGYVVFAKTSFLNLELTGEAFLLLKDANGEREEKIYGSNERSFRTTGSKLLVRFKGREKTPFGSSAQTNGFVLYFEQQPKPTVCKRNEVRCNNEQRCVSRTLRCNGKDECGDGTDEEDCFRANLKFSEACGQPSVKPLTKHLYRIVHGTPAKRGSWPWQASLRIARKEPDGHLCGGVLLNRQWILTAAHCFEEYSNEREWVVSLGRNNKVIRDGNSVLRYMSKIILHENSTIHRKIYDIALVKLNAMVPDDNPFIGAICLPPVDGSAKTTGAVCYITGWGTTEFGNECQNLLQQANVPIASEEQCKKHFRQLGENESANSEMVFCAGYEDGGADTCHGDSGGPIVKLNKESKQWELVGITLRGQHMCCGCSNAYGVYANIAKHMEWISHTIKKNN